MKYKYIKEEGWEHSTYQIRMIVKIADRYEKLISELPFVKPRLHRRQVITILLHCHRYVQPLQLQRLLDAPQPDLMHDIFGIAAHMQNYELTNSFLPRYAAF